MEFLYEYGLFLAKAVTLVIAIVIVLGVIAASAMKNKQHKKGELSITNLTDEFTDVKHQIQAELLSKEALKAIEKAEKEQDKADKKAAKEKIKAAKKQPSADDTTANDEKSKLFVIDFNGSMDAHEADTLREEVNAILSVIKPKDEVLVRLESPGGVVHGYGLASSQLARFRERDITLTAAVDKVAASGGYMMASVANTIVAAPFAIIGSIGVIAQLPNFHRLLKNNNVDFEQFTAGEFKRTVTMFGENTESGREKFKQELEETHDLFKAHINQYRPTLDIDSVATGEHWYGSQAKTLGLIDQVKTSDDYLLTAIEEKEVYLVKYQVKKNLADKLPIALSATLEGLMMRIFQRIQAMKHS